jgi:hypothetical protein
VTGPAGPGAAHQFLNANQRRHFEVLLAMLEDELDRIDRLALEPASPPAALTVLDDDLPADFANRARPMMEATRTIVRDLAARLRLKPRRVSRRRSISAALTAAIIRIDDSSPDELRGYGAVDPRFAEEFGPALDSIRESINGISALLGRHRAARREP